MKKLILKSVLCFAFVLSGLQLNAQIYTNNSTTPTSCNGSAQLLDSITYSSWIWMDSSGTNAIQAGDLFFGSLCPGTYSFVGTSSGGDTTIYFTIGTGSPCGGFSASITASQYASALGTCDGSLTVGTSGGSAPYSYSWTGGASGGSTAYGLCGNTSYTVTVNDANGCTASATGTVVVDSAGSNPCSGFAAYFSSVVNPSPGLCDGSLTAASTGGTAPFTYVWNTGATSATIGSLCANTVYSFTATDVNGCTSSSSIIPISDTVPENPCSSFSTYISVVQNATTTTGCNGVLTVSVLGGTAPFTYYWSNSGTTSTITNACAYSTYTVNVVDFNGCQSTVSQMIYLDSITNSDSSLVIYPSPTSVSADGICDGSLTIDTWGGNPPFAFALSNGMTNNTGYFDSLCQGIYTVSVYDSNGDSVFVDVIISNPSNTYNNNTYGDSLFVDSIMGNLQSNCQLNYQGIDSVFITDYTFVGDSIFVNWLIVTSTGNTVVTQAYYLGSGNGVYSLGLMVYCPGKALGNYFTATDQIYFGDALGVQENMLEDVSIYPNPATDNLNIQFTKAGNYSVSLYDLTGREMMNSESHDADHMTLNVSTLSKGQYVLKINGNYGFISKSIVK